MAELNQFAISRALGSTMSAGQTQRFGRLGLLPLVAKARRPAALAVTPGHLDGQYDQQIVDAFTSVARGKSRDRLFADPKLVREFIRAAKKLGVDAPPPLVNRRLMRLGKIGGRLPKTTEKGRNLTPDDQNIFAIEYGVVRIAHLHGATVDDILCEEPLGNEYKKIVELLAPGYSALIYRLGALYLRKTRNLKKAKRDVFAGLDPHELEESWVDLGSVNEAKKGNLTDIGPGILHVDEGSRSLYIRKTTSVAELASTFLRDSLWGAMGNHFWHPDPDRIHLRALPMSDLGREPSDWELRLIQSWEPVFNMKVG